MPDTIVRIHPSRRCATCAHVDTYNDRQCWQLVSMADGSAMPDDFGCEEHQTIQEFSLDLHRPNVVAWGSRDPVPSRFAFVWCINGL